MQQERIKISEWQVQPIPQQDQRYLHLLSVRIESPPQKIKSHMIAGQAQSGQRESPSPIRQRPITQDSSPSWRLDNPVIETSTAIARWVSTVEDQGLLEIMCMSSNTCMYVPVTRIHNLYEDMRLKWRIWGRQTESGSSVTTGRLSVVTVALRSLLWTIEGLWPRAVTQTELICGCLLDLSRIYCFNLSAAQANLHLFTLFTCLLETADQNINDQIWLSIIERNFAS